MEVKSETTIPSVEVKKVLAEKAKDKELGYEQKVTLDYLNKFSKVSQTKLNKLQTELREIGKLNDRHIAAIIGLLPKDLDDLRVLFSNERVDLTPADKEKILEIVNKD
ncbi:MAG TPA: RNA polymerase Rpb4 family protein [archaeon]|nr:RNA polymerase Rpb4 family protein [archaeon]